MATSLAFDRRKITLVEILYCEEVEGTIFSLTTIVRQHTYLYQGFTSIANVDDETGVLKCVNRNGVQHASYVMMLVNNLWYPEFVPQSTTFAQVIKFNDACLSNLWHGKLDHAVQGVIQDIHKHVIGIDKPIKHNTLYKCGSCLPGKMSKTPHKRTAKKGNTKFKYNNSRNTNRTSSYR